MRPRRGHAQTLRSRCPLRARSGKAAADGLLVIGGALAQAAIKLGKGWGHEKNVHERRLDGWIGVRADLLRSLHIDIEQNVLPRLERILDGLDGRAVVVIM